MNDKTILVLVLGGILLFTFGGGIMTDLRDAGTNFDFSWLTFGDASSGLVNVDKSVDFALANSYAGTALTSKTLLVYEQTATGIVQRHSLTTDATDGTSATPRTYPSGTQLYVYYASSNDKQWFSIVVPQMNPSDAESATVNSVALDSFAIGTYSTDALEFVNGTALADGGTLNTTKCGSTPQLIYTLTNTGNDNTGLMSSYDPLYKMNYNIVLWMTLSGTGYEKVLIYEGGFSEQTLGTTDYLYKTLDPYRLTTHKQGWQYLSRGTDQVKFWMDLTSLTTSDSVTWQFYLYAYSDPSYFFAHGGDYGYNKVEIAEHTITLTG